RITCGRIIRGRAGIQDSFCPVTTVVHDERPTSTRRPPARATGSGGRLAVRPFRSAPFPQDPLRTTPERAGNRKEFRNDQRARLFAASLPNNSVGRFRRQIRSNFQYILRTSPLKVDGTAK